ncbi:MAG: hypothetical protein ABSD68_01570 [Candidatus Micrarchaeales archaeon]|jgi:hypothetical protein
MESVGVYAFIGKNWRKNDFPLDLWLKHNEKLFDQVAVATHADLDLDIGDNVIVKKIPERYVGDFRFYLYSLTESQKLLDTDWKVLMPVDEFISQRIDPSKLDKRYVYPMLCRQLYGNINTEIVFDEKDPFFQYRVHYGVKPIIRDGGDVPPPYYARLSFGKLWNSMRNELFFYKRRLSVLGTKRYPEESYLSRLIRFYYRVQYEMSKPRSPYFTLWHTGFARNPKSFSIKSRQNMARDRDAHGKRLSTLTKALLKYSEKPKFDYASYKQIWPRAKLYKIDTNALPEIIRQNAKRFNWIKFKQKEYEKSSVPF